MKRKNKIKSTINNLDISWKTKLNRSISTVEDGIPEGLQHCHKMYCEKGGYCGRQAYMIWR